MERRQRTARLIFSGLVAALLLSTANLAQAQTVSDRQILDSLTTKTRSLMAAPPTAENREEQRFINSIRHLTRSLSFTERERVVEIARDRDKIDLEIYFDFDSASISSRAEPQIQALARALSAPSLRGALMVLNGHTDAKGTDAYNASLSERRAEAVKRYLVDRLGIASGNLSTAGHGRQHLKNQNQPYAPENRRVQVINLAPAAQASR